MHVYATIGHVMYICPTVQESAKHYALSAKLNRPFVFEGQDGFVVQ